MARALRIQFPGAFYHVTCRGNERREIFTDDHDREKFLVLLEDSVSTHNVVVYAYILMSNHFHLLIQTRKANASEFMRHFNICYTGWFNYRHQRCGHLYQGRYKAFLIDANSYFLEVSRYLHLNVVRSGYLSSAEFEERWQYLKEYRWSSLQGYFDKKQTLTYIDYDLILSMAGGRSKYREFISDGIRRDLSNPFESLKERVILGDDDFVAKVKGKYITYGSVREQPSLRGLTANAVAPKVVIDYVAEAFGIDAVCFAQRRERGFVRGLLAELLYKYCDLTQTEIARFLGGIDYGGVYQLRRRFRERMNQDRKIQEQYRRIEGKLAARCSM